MRLCSAAGAAWFDPFSLHARLDFDLADREAFPRNFPVLLHEYAHHLQSLSTVYGIYRVVDWIRTAVRLESILPLFDSVPLPVLQRYDDGPEELRRQMSDIAERLRWHHDLEQPSPLPHDTPLSDEIPIRVAKIVFQADGERHPLVVWIEDDVRIPIGARALSEGMAASVQRIWEQAPALDAILAALPAEERGWYTATRGVLARCAPERVDLDVLNVIVCDLALMTRNPPITFLHAILALLDIEDEDADPIAAVREALGGIITEEIEETRSDLANTIERLQSNAGESLARAVLRLLAICVELLDRRQKDIGWVGAMLSIDERYSVRKALEEFPLISYFRDDALFNVHGDAELDLIAQKLLMLTHALTLLLYGSVAGTECPLAATTTCKSPRSAICYDAPWLQQADAAGTVCAFGDALASLGIFGKRFDLP